MEMNKKRLIVCDGAASARIAGLFMALVMASPALSAEPQEPPPMPQEQVESTGFQEAMTCQDAIAFLTSMRQQASYQIVSKMFLDAVSIHGIDPGPGPPLSSNQAYMASAVLSLCRKNPTWPLSQAEDQAHADMVAIADNAIRATLPQSGR